MSCLPTIPRISIMFAAAALLAACTPAASEDEGETGESGDTGDTGDIEACIDPGTELLPNVKPAIVPQPQSSNMFTCTTGWGTDAPRLAPEWTVQVGEETALYNYVPPVLAAHPDGGAIIGALGQVAHYGTDGEPLWSNPAPNGQLYLAVEQAGTILVGAYDWMNEDTSLTRYAADGTSMGEIVIPWNSPYANIWGVTTFGSDIVIGANDEDAEGSYETTFIRLDVDGNVVLRKSTNQAGGNALAVTSGGTLLFGTFPGFLVNLDNGAVLGMLTPTGGNISAAIGVGDEFVVAANVAGATTPDLGIGRYTNLGGEQWLQTYDRATLGDSSRAVAADGDGNLVVVGSTSLLDFTDVYWFGTQPVVFGVDVDGNALWTDRIAAQADATAGAIDGNGFVYIAGMGDAGIGFDSDNGEEPPVVAWLRRYTP